MSAPAPAPFLLGILWVTADTAETGKPFMTLYPVAQKMNRISSAAERRIQKNSRFSQDFFNKLKP